MAEDGWAKFFPDVTHDGRQITMGNVPGLRPGGAMTYQSYDRPWANVSNAPFRLFKHYVHEGGISTPLIAHWPGRVVPQTVHDPAHVVDILPTILQATGAPYLKELGGHPIQPLQGESFLDLLKGADWSREQPIFFEHEGNCAIRAGEFKLVRRHGLDWELYNMDADRTELHNLIGRNAPLEGDLLKQFTDWADKQGVMDWETALPRLLAVWGMETAEG